nr:hypothetical protein [uncultured Cellulosilyticum sp.]
MDNFASSYMSLTNFEHIYNTNIRPKLEAIDTFLKTTAAPYDINAVATLFETTTHNILRVMNELSLTSLDRLSFFTLICHLPHDICHLIQRQWQYQNAPHYTAEMIAHIYTLNIHKVETAFKELGVDIVYEHELMEVFKHIHISIFKF